MRRSTASSSRRRRRRRRRSPCPRSAPAPPRTARRALGVVESPATWSRRPTPAIGGDGVVRWRRRWRRGAIDRTPDRRSAVCGVIDAGRSCASIGASLAAERASGMRRGKRPVRRRRGRIHAPFARRSDHARRPVGPQYKSNKVPPPLRLPKSVAPRGEHCVAARSLWVAAPAAAACGAARENLWCADYGPGVRTLRPQFGS